MVAAGGTDTTDAGTNRLSGTWVLPLYPVTKSGFPRATFTCNQHMVGDPYFSVLCNALVDLRIFQVPLLKSGDSISGDLCGFYDSSR